MSKQVQTRRGTALEHESFTGALGEVTVNTDTNEQHVHDGVNVGGHSESSKTKTILINDLSQEYTFSTDVAYQAFATAFPVGKKIRLTDRDARFTIIAGVATANDMDIIGNAGTNQSAKLLEGNDVSLSMLGAVTSTNAAAHLTRAVQTYRNVNLLESYSITLSSAQAALVIPLMDRVTFHEYTTINVGAGEVSFPERVLFSNSTMHNLELKGVDNDRVDASAVSVSGVAKNHVVTFTVPSHSVIVDQYIIVTSVIGDKYSKGLSGCWKVTSVTGTTITVKHTANSTFPAVSITSAGLYPISTIFRWPNDTVGLAVTTIVNTISNVVIAGNFDVTTGAASDGAVDGLQVGTSPNTPVTGLNESEQSNTGSLYLARAGIVEWSNNANQVFGTLYAVLTACCSNGWRGYQAGRGGSIIAKYSAASGNGASGYEAEENGFVLADGSVAMGNWHQGYYAIGGGSISAGSSLSLANRYHGYEAKNFATILADGATSELNVMMGVTTTSGFILFGAGAASQNNTIKDIAVVEGGKFNASGGGTIGTTRVDLDSKSIYIPPSGAIALPDITELQHSNGRAAQFSISSLGDYNISFDPTNSGKFTGAVRIKNNGTLHPLVDGVPTLGRPTDRWNTIYSTDGTINTSDAREKTLVSKFTDKELDAAKLLSKEIGGYKWLASIEEKGDYARYHVGMTVQRAIEIMESFDLDAMSYGFICYDEWESENAELDDEGNVVIEAIEAGNRYGFRYSQLNMFILAGINARLEDAGI